MGMNNCDKCGGSVPRGNDAVLFDAINHHNPLLILFGYSRHLMPVIEGGMIRCEGSPSRAQYLDGQPRDRHPEYAYRPEMEARYRAVYDEMQRQMMAANAVNN